MRAFHKNRAHHRHSSRLSLGIEGPPTINRISMFDVIVVVVVVAGGGAEWRASPSLTECSAVVGTAADGVPIMACHNRISDSVGCRT